MDKLILICRIIFYVFTLNFLIMKKLLKHTLYFKPFYQLLQQKACHNIEVIQFKNVVGFDIYVFFISNILDTDLISCNQLGVFVYLWYLVII